MFFFFEQKTADEMRISDWSSDVCSSDLYSLLLIVLLARPQGLLGKRTLEALGGAGAASGSMPTTSLLAAGTSSQRGRHADLFLRPRWLGLLRSAARRVGKEWVGKGSFRWSPSPYKTKKKKKTINK